MGNLMRLSITRFLHSSPSAEAFVGLRRRDPMPPPPFSSPPLALAPVHFFVPPVYNSAVLCPSTFADSISGRPCAGTITVPSDSFFLFGSFFFPHGRGCAFPLAVCLSVPRETLFARSSSLCSSDHARKVRQWSPLTLSCQ